MSIFNESSDSNLIMMAFFFPVLVLLFLSLILVAEKKIDATCVADVAKAQVYSVSDISTLCDL